MGFSGMTGSINLVRLHKTLRVTPAMAANVTDRIWSLEGIGRPKEQSEIPRPMKVKMFMDAKPSTIEEQINAWLDYPRFSNHHKNGNRGHGDS
jgi:hypothetical protein